MEENESTTCRPTERREPVKHVGGDPLRPLDLPPAAADVCRKAERTATPKSENQGGGLLPRVKGLAEPILQRLGLDGMAKRIWRRLRRTFLRRSYIHAARQALEPRNLPCGYDVICLPVIAWHSRFQRPQQLMRQFAKHGHRVFYASLAFHAGNEAELTPIEEGVFECALPGAAGVNVYRELPSAADVEAYGGRRRPVAPECRIASAVVVVQLPFWTALADQLRRRFAWPIVYDCMDDHAGFSTNCESMLKAEQRTVADVDLVVVTSDVAPRKGRGEIPSHGAGPQRVRLRPLCAGRASTVETAARKANHGGFYGAIAEWFDSALVADLAQLQPDWKFELIGSTFTGDVSRLQTLANVRLLGEKPYADLPRLAAGWDCFIIPFRRIPLTEATNPVKAYEMLATGKPVVAVDLPELRPMAQQKLLTLANDGREFALAIGRHWLPMIPRSNNAAAISPPPIRGRGVGETSTRRCASCFRWPRSSW